MNTQVASKFRKPVSTNGDSQKVKKQVKTKRRTKPAIQAFSSPTLKEGEQYAGIILGKNGEQSYHLILLLGETEDTNWEKSIDWAKSVGGELPTQREQALLYANLKEQFTPDWYWSCEQHAAHADYAWAQLFGYGFQSYYRKSLNYCARAVRRLIINDQDHGKRIPGPGSFHSGE
jgi:hypothetical protein